ncbi:acyl-CoA 6-desaturase isoform X2 [Corythoichthys intestinalis]|uniref:acyl-CoA 6-desaturase isoform X2 n=1 Tax=Corythoichthys intestinalis TaxID=161448 RepID=UPI0025A4F3A3|nr:acyl-CoA 6-desaturase isoform X2 [Corythoichthys intestinalis]
MGAGGQQTEMASCSGIYTWEEVQSHCRRNDMWLVIQRKVYNVTNWATKHPGGFRVIHHYAGEDATEAFTAFHPDKKFVHRFLKPLLIGKLAETEPNQDRQKNAAVSQDFKDLRARAVQQGLFRAHPLFFMAHLIHIVLLEVLAWLLVWFWGTNWISTIVCAVLMATAQIQAGWLQHDFGHLSVFKKSTWNHLAHKFLIGHLKGASANWWNHRHFQHHAKPNIFSKDPDVNMLRMFVIGSVQPVEYGTKKIKHMPYNHQHRYFFLVGPPLLIPVYFHLQIMRVMIVRRDWVDMAWALSYYLRYFSCYIQLYGLLGSFALIVFVRFLESHWFVWVTQMSHLPMDIDHEKHQDWLTMQLQATCNIEESPFNDWFSGHLNFQIEHQ